MTSKLNLQGFTTTELERRFKASPRKSAEQVALFEEIHERGMRKDYNRWRYYRMMKHHTTA